MMVYKRVFLGIDAHSSWSTPTKNLQVARRYKGKQIQPAFLDRALQILALGRPDPDEVASAPVRCPLCKKKLSAVSVVLGPFIWGEESAHYLVEHQIWPPELDELLVWAGENVV